MAASCVCRKTRLLGSLIIRLWQYELEKEKITTQKYSMLDLFTIFSKGGIVLWYFQGTTQLFTAPVNALIKSVILQERGGNNSFTHEALTLKYKLDNEFELVFVVAYQKILQLEYVDKLLNDVQRLFRDQYKDDLQSKHLSRNFDGFTTMFQAALSMCEEESRNAAKKPREMRSFQESQKSQKKVSSMIESRSDLDMQKAKKESLANKKGKKGAEPGSPKSDGGSTKQNGKAAPTQTAAAAPTSAPGEDEDAEMARRREEFFKKRMGGGSKSAEKPKKDASPSAPKKKGKSARVWELGGTNQDAVVLDHSEQNGGQDGEGQEVISEDVLALVGQMKGDLRDLDTESSADEEEEEEEEMDEEIKGAKTTNSSQPGRGFSMFGALKGLVGSKTLTRDSVDPALDKVKEHIIAKNVAADIADKLCHSVATKLEGRVLGTFSSVASTVKQTFHDSCVQILSPRRRVDILRDAMEAKVNKRPFSIVFCGVNGVGKSTNLAKIAFWLVENNFRVLIAACDTFRAGAVEQLRTHTRKLNALHPPEKHNGLKMVQLYEKGYGKDAAGIAMEAINHARDTRLDIVLIDTAGRMQDNEPLMRALSKLIKVNQPDLVLFVGEALVGNEAVDQLVKFNQALADHSSMDNPHLIDGIVLTKFDTIDDKVGAAISMTYITGQPIVFVGTGQTYLDLKNLNAKAVVNALLK